MGATFTKVNCVCVNPTLNQNFDAYPDSSLALGGTYAANLAPEQNPIATYGTLVKGMPVRRSITTGKIVPPSAAASTTSWLGVLTDDLTSRTVIRNTKITYCKKGRVRSYAGGALTTGDPVKEDTSANFSGFVKWVSGTDDPSILRGYFSPIADGSDGNTPAVSAAQGDTIFVDLI